MRKGYEELFLEPLHLGSGAAQPSPWSLPEERWRRVVPSCVPCWFWLGLTHLASWLDLGPVLPLQICLDITGLSADQGYSVVALFCSPCLRAVRWGPSQWIPYPVGLTVLPGSWCLCFCRETPLSQLLDSTVFWTKNHFYSALHCEQNNCSGIKSLWWPISSCRPDLNGFPAFRIGDLMEVTVHNLENPLQYGNDM